MSSWVVWLCLIIGVSLGSCGPQTVYNAIPGPAGSPGVNGHSVVFASTPAPLCAAGGNLLLFATDANNNGVLDAGDTNVMSAQVCNGADAPPNPFTPVSILNPCGSAGPHDEVMLKLASGQVLASFSQTAAGQNTRFSLLAADTQYVTTDADLCYFKLDVNGNLYDEHH